MVRGSGPAYFFFKKLDKYFSKAETMEGACGCGALISSTKPASSTARDVLIPKAPILVPFCWYLGKLSKRLLTPLGVKKQMISYSCVPSNSLMSLLMVQYMKGVA